MKKIILLLFMNSVLFAAQSWDVSLRFDLNDAQIYDMCIIENEIWCATTSGVFVYDQSSQDYSEVELYPNSLYCQAIASTSRDNIWIGTLRNGIFHYDGDKWNHYTQNNSLPGNRINDLLFDSQQRLWIATENGLLIYDGTVFSPVLIGNSHQSSVLGIKRDTADVIYAEMRGGAVYSVNQKYNKQICDLDGSFRKYVQIDHGGNMWLSEHQISAKDHNVVLNQDNFSLVLPSKFKPGLVVPFVVTDCKTVIAGCNDGIALWQEGSTWKFIDLKMKTGNKINMIKRDKGDIFWIAAGSALYKFSLSANTLIAPKNEIAFQNYPNPFNPQTKVCFSLPREMYTTLTVYNILGRKVDILLQKRLAAGTHNVTWNASPYPSGVYYAVLETPEKRLVKKLVLQK